MKLVGIPRKVILEELDRAFKVAPPYNSDEEKEDLIGKDLLELAGKWEEDAFKATMAIVRRRFKTFPTVEKVEELYWQTLKEQKPITSEIDQIEKVFRQRLETENALYAQILSLPYEEKRDIIEQAEDEIEEAHKKLFTAREGSTITEAIQNSFAQKLMSSKADAIKGRAISILKERIRAKNA